MKKRMSKRVKRYRKGHIRCRVCGCTDIDPCNPPCAWMDGDLCTTCAYAVHELIEWADEARRANLAGLLREYRRQRLDVLTNGEVTS